MPWFAAAAAAAGRILPFLARSGATSGILRGASGAARTGAFRRAAGWGASRMGPTFTNPAAQASALRWEVRTARTINAYNKISPFITGGVVTAGFGYGFMKGTIGDQDMIDSLRFLGGKGAPLGMESKSAPFVPIQPNVPVDGMGYTREDMMNAPGQLALDTFYTRHNR